MEGLGDSGYQQNIPFDQFLTWQIAGDLMAQSIRRATDRDGF